MSTSSGFRRAQLPLLAALTGLVAGACIYDSDHRCGPAMTYVDAIRTCVCNDDAIAVPGGCQVCAADEVPVGGSCACRAGQTKNADNLCVVVAGLGDPCDTQSSPCTDAMYSYCDVRHGGTAGTCANRCASNDECGAAYTCATWEPAPYCRTFDGAGATCASPSDCTGDAKFCDTFTTHSCVVSDCSLTDHDCPRGTLCCDFSGFGLGTLCAGACQ
jgi:hypothetical protein